MKTSLDLVLLVIAFVLFLLAAFPIPSRVSLGWLGAAFATLSFIV